jgi:hypothetical protein
MVQQEVAKKNCTVAMKAALEEHALHTFKIG